MPEVLVVRSESPCSQRACAISASDHLSPSRPETHSASQPAAAPPFGRGGKLLLQFCIAFDQFCIRVSPGCARSCRCRTEGELVLGAHAYLLKCVVFVCLKRVFRVVFEFPKFLLCCLECFCLYDFFIFNAIAALAFTALSFLAKNAFIALAFAALAFAALATNALFFAVFALACTV